jgi:hypothetical protein
MDFVAVHRVSLLTHQEARVDPHSYHVTGVGG